MRKFRDFIAGSEATNEAVEFKILTKNQLIKKLKDTGNYNYNFVKKLSSSSDFIYSKGNYSYLQGLSSRAADTALKKIEDLLASIEDLFDEKKEKKAKDEMLDNLKGAINRKFKDDSNAVNLLVKELAKEMSSDDLYTGSIDDIKYKLNHQESIGVAGRTSTWTTTISGSWKIEGKDFFAKDVYVHSETNRL